MVNIQETVGEFVMRHSFKQGFRESLTDEGIFEQRFEGSLSGMSTGMVYTYISITGPHLHCFVLFCFVFSISDFILLQAVLRNNK